VSSTAPVMILVYDRYEKLRNCVRSLQANPLARDTDLYIVSDAGRPEHTAAVARVREYCRTVDGFRTVTTVERELNLGATRSWWLAEQDIGKRYGRVITMEDDNEVAANFLDFMNQALDYYEPDPRIFSVCGYRAPFEVPPRYAYDYWFGPWHVPWAYGTWHNRLTKFDVERNDFSAIFDSAERRSRLRSLGRFMYDSAWLDWNGIARANDARTCMHMFVNDMVSVMPTVTKVRNTGQDGSGLHAKVTRRFDVILDDGQKRNFSFGPYSGFDAAMLGNYRSFMDQGTLGTLIRDVGLKRLRYRLRQKWRQLSAGAGR
jgi:hypothetical protein